MAYPQQQRSIQPQQRQQRFYDQGHPQQQQHHQDTGYDYQYDQQYYDQGYDQGAYEQWDGYYDQQGRWVQTQQQQQGGHGGMDAYPSQPPQQQRRRQPPQQQYAPDPPYEGHQPQRPAPRQDPRSRPTSHGSGPPSDAQRGRGRGGLRPPGLDRSLLNPVAPKNLPQDNPFPTFPTKKVQQSAPKAKMDEAVSRLSITDRHSGQEGIKASPPRRQPVPPQNRIPQQPRPISNGVSGRQDSGHFEGHGQEQRPPPGRAPPGQRPPRMNMEAARAPPPRRPSDPNSPSHRAFAPTTQRSVTMPQTVPREQGRGFENQEQWVEPGATPGYYDVSSPTYVAPRPATAGGVRQTDLQPQPQQRLPVPQMAPQQPHQQQYQAPQQHVPPHDDMDNFYDDYYGEVDDTRSVTPGIDMPNFDAIPVTNSMHRRGDSINHHLSPAAGVGMRGLTQTVSATDVPTHEDVNPHIQTQRSHSQPDLHAPYAGEIHEMPGDAPPVPVLPRAHTGFDSHNAPPNDPRGRMPPVRGMTTDAVYRGPTNAAYFQDQSQQFDTRKFRQAPPIQRGYSGESAFSEPPLNATRSGPSPMAPGNPIPRPGTAGPATGRVPVDPMGRRPGTSQSNTNPDALPPHPVPVRPGLVQQGQQQQPPQSQARGSTPQSVKPPPVRQYNSENARAGYDGQQPNAKRQSDAPHPVTHDELNRLRNTWRANPADNAMGLLFAKKLVEAASVLADEGGKADTRTRNKNREKFVLEAHKTIKKLVASGYAEAMFYLADCYGQGLLGLQVDTKEAFLLYQSGAKAGHGASAYRTAVCCEMGHEEGGGTKRDPLKAVQWYRRAAALGDTPALYKMGMILLKGLLGQQINFGEAVNMLKRAAERADKDNPHALHELALIYESPGGIQRVIQDEAYSLQLFHQAADLGYKFSQFRLGQAYEYGLLGCPIDARTSIAWYTRAAAQEEHQSELALSGWYLTGTSGILEQSDTEAYLWARKAACAEPPLPKALFAMGYFTEVGIGCPRSLDEAKRWYGRAAAYKFPKAQERLEELKRGGSKVQMKRERLSRTNQKQQEENCIIM